MHILINIIGTVICLSVWLILDNIFHFSMTNQAATPVGMALVHTIFNVATTCILLPFTKLLEKLTLKLLPDKANDKEVSLLDDRLLKTPLVALAESRNAMIGMAKVAQKYDDVFTQVHFIRY